MRRVTKLDRDIDRVYDALDRGGIEKAVRDAERLLAGNPNEPEALLAAATVWQAAGRYNDAVAAARRVAAALPDDHVPLLIEAQCLLDMDRPEEALGALDSAPPPIAFSPFVLACRVELLARLKRRKEVRVAVGSLVQMRVSADEAEALLEALDGVIDTLELCGFQREADSVGAAADVLDEALDAPFEEGDDFDEEPDGRPLLVTDAPIIVEAIRKDPDVLRRFMEGQTASFPGLGEKDGWEDRAAIAFVDVMWRWMDSGAPLVVPPENASADLQKSVEAVNRGDGIVARQLAQKALVVDPENATALAVLGHAAALRGNYLKALEWFTRAVALTPGDAGLQAHRSCAAAMAGNKSVALEAMEASLAAHNQTA